MIKNKEIKNLDKSDKIIGIDIGSTNISAVIIDIEKNSIIKSYTIANDSKLITETDLYEFNADCIADKVKALIENIISIYQNIQCIGLTGQMHGIVYVDKTGKSVSPLYSWQDGRANRIFYNGKTYCDEILSLTGYRVFSGYGISTLFYNKCNHIEPSGAVSFCTIADYIAMVLTCNAIPYLHPSNAAGIGLFNLKDNEFDTDAMNKIGISHLRSPVIESNIIGRYRNIPVSVAIGDNQASFFGSVKQDSNTALVNFGTGSQISVAINSVKKCNKDLEIRPYLFNKFLLCGSALCGGKAYSIIEKFFSKYARLIDEQVGSQYKTMNELAEKAYIAKECLNVSTRFCGTRNEPDLKGYIKGIDDNNFTPEGLILGTLYGIVEELYSYFEKMNVNHISNLVASGNLIRKNPLLASLLKDVFGFDVVMTNNDEEAAVGAALYSAMCSNTISKQQIDKIIIYK